MPARIYLETTIVSMLAARPSRDIVQLAHQRITSDWWSQRRTVFDLHVSELVIAEARQGDPDAAERRMALIANTPVLRITPEARALALRLVQAAALPANALADALHIAVATAHGMAYVLSWNCKHIANAEKRPHIEAVAREAGYVAPHLCTPEELMGS